MDLSSLSPSNPRRKLANAKEKDAKFDKEIKQAETKNITRGISENLVQNALSSAMRGLQQSKGR